MDITIVGLDCATVDEKVGIALAHWSCGHARVAAVELCRPERSAVAAAAEWLKALPGPSLVAIDAPLGWPAAMGPALSSHRAGQGIDVAPNDMFRRTTDRSIKKRLGKTPLDVGADRIARTAHAALRMLAELRAQLGRPVPLAWSKDLDAEVMAIEVYPAATLAARGLPSSRYKGPKDGAARESLTGHLRSAIGLPDDVSLLHRSADALDAVVCALAAADFLCGRAMKPGDQPSAEKEGWIWVLEP